MCNLHTPAHANRAHRNGRRGAAIRLGALAVVRKGCGAAAAVLRHRRRPVVPPLRVLRRPARRARGRAAAAVVVVVVAGLGLGLGAAAAARLARPASAAEDAEERGEGVVLLCSGHQLADGRCAQGEDRNRCLKVGDPEQWDRMPCFENVRSALSKATRDGVNYLLVGHSYSMGLQQAQHS